MRIAGAGSDQDYWNPRSNFRAPSAARAPIWKYAPRMVRPSHCTSATDSAKVAAGLCITATPSRTPYCFLYAWEERTENLGEWPTICPPRSNSLKIEDQSKNPSLQKTEDWGTHKAYPMAGPPAYRFNSVKI